MATETLVGATAGFDLLSGIFGMSAGEAEAESLRSQAQLLRVESEAEISRYSAESDAFKANQKLAFLKNGITLEGSPLDILDHTIRTTTENISAMRSSSASKARALRDSAVSASSAGRTAFLKGVVGAGARIIKSGKELGWNGFSTTDKRGQRIAARGDSPIDFQKEYGQGE